VPPDPTPDRATLPLPPDVQEVPSYSKVVAESVPDAAGGFNLPKTTAPAVKVPIPPPCVLVAGILVTSVHVAPLYSSTSAFRVDGGYVDPPASTAAVCDPKPAASSLPVFKSPLDAQPAPFYSCVVTIFLVSPFVPPATQVAVLGVDPAPSPPSL